MMAAAQGRPKHGHTLSAGRPTYSLDGEPT